MRRLVACAVAAALVPLAGSAGAAPKKPRPQKLGCRPLVTDPRGDAGRTFEALDIVEGALACSRSEVVAVLRLASPVAPQSPHGVGGAAYRLGVNVNGSRMEFALRATTGANPSWQASVSAGHSAPKFSYAIAGTAILWRVQRRELPAFARSKILLTDAAASTTAYGLAADTAS